MEIRKKKLISRDSVYINKNLNLEIFLSKLEMSHIHASNYGFFNEIYLVAFQFIRFGVAKICNPSITILIFFANK